MIQYTMPLPVKEKFYARWKMESKELEFHESDGIKINLSDCDWKQIASKDVIAKMVQREGSFAYDICRNGEIIGFALFRRFEDGIFLWQYAIADEFQGRGYGYAALQRLMELIRAEKNIAYFTTTYSYGNLRAKKLYEKLGFKETDIVDEDGIHEVNMELVL